MRKKTLGLILVLFALVLLPLTLAGYAIITFMLALSGDGEQGVGLALFIKLVLGLMGIVAVLGFFIGIPVGIYFLTRKDPDIVASLRVKPRFQGLTDQEVHLVSKWSWSAFINPFIWAIGNRLWLWALGFLVPFWGVYVWLRLAIDGRQLVWERSTLTIEQFKKRQKILAWIVGIVTVGSIILSVPALGSFVSSSVKGAVTDSPSGSRELEVQEFDAVVEEEATVSEELETNNESEDSFTSFGGSYSCKGFRDFDGDGLTDEQEESLSTDPEKEDTDADGYDDYAELVAGYSPNNTETYEDTDGDGLADAWEIVFYHSEETEVDSDGNGVNDYDEVRSGTSPNGPGSLIDGSGLMNYLVLVKTAQRQCDYTE